MRKAMFALALFVLVPATALAGPFKSERSAKSSPLPQIASLGGDFPTSLSDEDLATNADADTNARADYSHSNTLPVRPMASANRRRMPFRTDSRNMCTSTGSSADTRTPTAFPTPRS